MSLCLIPTLLFGIGSTKVDYTIIGNVNLYVKLYHPLPAAITAEARSAIKKMLSAKNSSHRKYRFDLNLTTK